VSYNIVIILVSFVFRAQTESHLTRSSHYKNKTR